MGMGPQPLSPESAQNIGRAMMKEFAEDTFYANHGKCFPFLELRRFMRTINFLLFMYSGVLSMLVIGCGYAEEWIPLAKLFKMKKLPFHFYLVESAEQCFEYTAKLVETEGYVYIHINL